MLVSIGTVSLKKNIYKLNSKANALLSIKNTQSSICYNIL